MMAEDVNEDEAYPDPFEWRRYRDGDGVSREDGGAQGKAPGTSLMVIPDEQESGPAQLRYRHDGFTPGKQRLFLEALKETGCVEDACRAAGVSDTTAYRTRARLPDFAKRWDTALAMASTTIEMIAFERATIGADKTIIRKGKVVQIERRPSDVILRAIMQNTTRGHDAASRAALKAELKREIYNDSIADEPRLKRELAEKLEMLLGKLRERKLREMGYTIGPEGHVVPPGFQLVRDAGAKGSVPDDDAG